MIIVEGWVDLEPGELEKFAGAATAMVAATLKEDGCLHYSMAADLGQPDVVRISERWRDEAALTAHFASPHMGEFNKALAGLNRKGADVRAYHGEEVRRLI